MHDAAPGYDDGFCPKPIDQSSPPMHQLILQICESRGLVMALALQLLINNSSPQMKTHRLILQNLRIAAIPPQAWIVLFSSEIQSMQRAYVSRLTTHVKDRACFNGDAYTLYRL